MVGYGTPDYRGSASYRKSIVKSISWIKRKRASMPQGEASWELANFVFTICARKEKNFLAAVCGILLE